MKNKRFWSLWRLAVLEYQFRGDQLSKRPTCKATELRFVNSIVRLQRFDRVAKRRGLSRLKVTHEQHLPSNNG